MCAYNFGDAPCQKIPNDNATIIAPNGQQSAPAVEGAGEGHTDTVEGAICLLIMQETKMKKKKIKGQRSSTSTITMHD